MLREHRLASGYQAPGDLVCCTALGRGLDYRDVGEGFRAAVNAAGLTGPGRLSLHSLRHTFASLLIAKGLDVLLVAALRERAATPTGGGRRLDGGAETETAGHVTRRLLGSPGDGG